MLQLVCIDVDGTLIGESGQPSNSVLDAIMHARSLGQTLAPVSLYTSDAADDMAGV